MTYNNIADIANRKDDDMNRRKFLQLSCIAPVGMLSCKQQKDPIVSKSKRSQVPATRRHDLDHNGSVVAASPTV